MKIDLSANKGRLRQKGTGFKLVWIYNEMFTANIYLAVGLQDDPDILAITNAACGMNVQPGEILLDSNAKATEYVNPQGHSRYFIFMRELDMKKPKDIGVLAHEAYHITNMVLSHRGVLHEDTSGPETHCYFMGWLIENLLGQYKHFKK